MESFEFFNSVMGDAKNASMSKDGKAVIREGEISDGVPISMILRPSTSNESAIDVNIDGTVVRHVEGSQDF